MLKNRNRIIAQLLSGCLLLNLFTAPVFGEGFEIVEEDFAVEAAIDIDVTEPEAVVTETVSEDVAFSEMEASDFSGDAAEAAEQETTEVTEESDEVQILADEEAEAITEAYQEEVEGFITEEESETLEAAPLYINSIIVTGFPQPLQGEAVGSYQHKGAGWFSDLSMKVENNLTSYFSVDVIDWYYEDGRPISETEFQAGKTYLASMYVKVNQSSVYCFPDKNSFTATINGKSAEKEVAYTKEYCILKTKYTVPNTVKNIGVSGWTAPYAGNKPVSKVVLLLDNKTLSGTKTVVQCKKYVKSGNKEVVQDKASSEAFEVGERIYYEITITLPDSYLFAHDYSIPSDLQQLELTENRSVLKLRTDVMTAAKIPDGLFMDFDGKLRYYRDGKFDSSMTGMISGPADYPGIYYVKEGVADPTKTFAILYNGIWRLIKEGKDAGPLTGFYEDTDKKWRYAANGVLDTSYSGLAVKYEDGKLYYAKEGVLDSSANLLTKYQGQWHKVVSGTDNGLWTGIVTDGNQKYVRSGVFYPSFTGLAQKYNDTKWYYVANGVVNLAATGYLKYTEKWFFVKNGIAQKRVTGFYKEGGVWKTAKDGVPYPAYTGLAKRLDNGKYYYASNGVFDGKFTGSVKQSGKWYFVKDGQKQGKLTGFFKENGVWKVARSGVYDNWYTGLAERPDNKKLYFAYNGVFYKKFNGTVLYKKKKYKVVNGVAVMSSKKDA
ncbi:MAG: hypothetical protein HUJ72_07400 [Blautia sp.]|nr:hypothetical protein [Blautia sp.]